MTIEINLLPWRAAHREQRSRRFMGLLLLMVLLGAGGGWGVQLGYQQALDAQQQRNAHIQAQTQQLDRDIQVIRDYQALRERMLTQIGLIRELQFSRPQTVRVFNQLVTSLQEGVYYKQVSRQGSRLDLNGLAETNRQVSDQMRAIAAAAAFSTPTLSEVQADEGGSLRRFEMSVQENLPEAEDIGEEAP